MKNILVVGSINVDYVIYTDRQPNDGETVQGHGFSVNCGGKGANQAIAASKLGAKVKMLGAVGYDSGADVALSTLDRYGVDRSSVISADVATGSAVITVCNSDNRIIIDSGANDLVTDQLINENSNLFEWADIVVLQNEIPFEGVIKAAKVAKEHGCFVIYNPAPINKNSHIMFELCDLAVPNEHEASEVTGIKIIDVDTAYKALKALKLLGCRNSVITLGALGCVYNYEGETGYVPALKVDAVDTTAAGDSFIGAICQYFDAALFSTTLKCASVVSAMTVCSKGAACSIPNSSEVFEYSKRTLYKDLFN